MMGSKKIQKNVMELVLFKQKLQTLKNFSLVVFAPTAVPLVYLTKTSIFCFLINHDNLSREQLELPFEVPRSLRNLKSNMKSHITNSNLRKHKVEEKEDLLNKYLELPDLDTAIC